MLWTIPLNCPREPQQRSPGGLTTTGASSHHNAKYLVIRKELFVASPPQNISLLQRLMAKVEITESGCWLWHGNFNNQGYGYIGVDYKKKLVHRLSWELHFGPIPEGMQMCHRCDVPLCVNPGHLFIGTATDNVRDMFSKDRNGWTSRVYPENMPCVKGHEPNWTFTKRGRRKCQTCQREASREWQRKMRAEAKSRGEVWCGYHGCGPRQSNTSQQDNAS